MSLPFFYNEKISSANEQLVLDEDTSRHVVQVLRMKVGEQLLLTDGKGKVFTAEIVDDHKKKCVVSITAETQQPKPGKQVSIGISLVKNSSRFEWFLEKATEIGVTEIFPLLCERTEKQHFRSERMTGILISAMLQSKQSWLPVLHEPQRFENLLMHQFADYNKLIAHCLEDGNKENIHHRISKSPNQLILIGPEGDFSAKEIEEALKNNFIPVELGKTRLRTETAGIVAATILCIA